MNLIATLSVATTKSRSVYRNSLRAVTRSDMHVISRRMFQLAALLVLFSQLDTAALPTGVTMRFVSGGVFTMGSDSLVGSPTQQTAAPEHQVTLSPYWMSEAEISNAQYCEFLNEAYQQGLVSIVVGTAGPDNGKRLVQGTALSSYQGKTLYTLDGTRVLKDHDNADGDDNAFTGDVEPENPLNISYIGFDSIENEFYVKNQHDPSDFDWENICDYQDCADAEDWASLERLR